MESNGITRREMLKGVGLVGAGALLGSGLTLAGTRWESGISQGAGSERPWYELGIIGEPIMDNQLLWYLSHTGQGMADIGECLDTASRIDAADAYSWPREWLMTAERVRKMAENSLARGHKRSAGEVYLRAANYYRAALIHHPEPRDPGVVGAGRQSVACYNRALELLAIPAQPVRIPYDPQAFNTAVEGLAKAWPTARWWFRDAAWKHGATSPADLMMKLKEFNNEDVVDQIGCQMLVMDGTAEEFTAGQARKLYDALKSPKEYMLFTKEDTGLVHCQTGALSVTSQRMFDWLDETI